ncbi:hypothetical protein [Vibrio sp. HN007]|uniref:hypothetical protein n=1 Tax=Vibrio iocasae TaxID=3098914 RepID=UPI0035D50042
MTPCSSNEGFAITIVGGMMIIEYQYKGYKGELSLVSAERIEVFREHYYGLNYLYIVDQLISMVVRLDEQVLSITQPDCTVRELAEINCLSDIKITIDSILCHKII